MLIYNFKKEFIGIDEKDLRTLGFKNLGELRTEVTDFADLFVRTPGFIHNFKHVHWIDFITCADSNEESKVIINVNNKNYRSTIQISTAYLVDNPTSKSFLINLHNLRELTNKESERISSDIIQREAPSEDLLKPETFNIESEENLSDTVVDEYDSPLEIDISDDFDIQEPSVETIEPLEISLDDEPTPEISLDVKDTDKIEILSEPTLKDFDNGYTYDPHIASEELGLPLDLIEEFIQDFILQAKEFKDDLYKSVEDADFDTLRTLSHKLKGVAANLRIEDALEALTTTNSSSDFNEITKNLNILYASIAKLEGVTIDVEKEDEIYIEIEDSQVPEKIELPELADDTFVETIQFSDIENTEDEELTLKIDDDELFLEIKDSTETPQVEYSREHVAKEIGLDLASFNELFEDFSRETKALLTSMTQAIEKENFELCSSEAMKLKGMSDNMRLNSYADAIEVLMTSQDKVALSAAIEDINTTLTQLSR